MRRIILAGKDLSLLDTRAAILRKTGSQVVGSSSVAEALGLLRQERFGLVVLCHTLDDAETRAITDAVRESSPWTKVLMMVSEVNEHVRDGDHSGRFDALSPADPARLIRQATDLLGGTACVSE